MDFFGELYLRNASLTIFGLACFAGALFCFAMLNISQVQVLGINAWIKPLKFFISTIIFVWSMAWYLGHLPTSGIIVAYNWTVIIVLAFELLYITWQASRGELSHFNVSTPGKATMFSLMGTSISIMTLFTLFIGVLFFTTPLPELPSAYLWGIRLGIIFFVIFAFEGGIMGSKLAHTVGGPDGSLGIKFLNWSLSKGDLRIAHFVGMHALQVLPILGYYVLTSTKFLIGFAFIYFGIATSVLIQALMGLPLIKQ